MIPISEITRHIVGKSPIIFYRNTSGDIFIGKLKELEINFDQATPNSIKKIIVKFQRIVRIVERWDNHNQLKLTSRKVKSGLAIKDSLVTGRTLSFDVIEAQSDKGILTIKCTNNEEISFSHLKEYEELEGRLAIDSKF